MDEGRVAVCHAFGFAYKQHVSERLPYGVYTIPEVSSVGITQEQAAERAIRSVPVVPSTATTRGARSSAIVRVS